MDTSQQDFNQGSNLESEPTQMPLGVSSELDGGESIGTALDDASALKRSYSSQLLIALVVVVAIAGLFTMRTVARATADVPEDEGVAALIGAYLNPNASGTEAEIDLGDEIDGTFGVLTDTYLQKQVELSNVQKNPFVLDMPRPVIVEPEVVTEEPEPNAAELARLQREQERDELRASMLDVGGGMTLTSVLMGTTSVAKINGEILEEGDIVHMEFEEAVFRVETIRRNAVTVVGENDEYDVTVTITLNLDAP